MSFVHKETLEPVEESEEEEHLAAKMTLANKEMLRQLKVCTPFVDWVGGDEKTALPYADFASWAWRRSQLHPDLDMIEWTDRYGGPTALERSFTAVFKHIEKKPHETLAEWLHAIDKAARFVPDGAERDSTVMSLADMVETAAARGRSEGGFQPEEFELHVHFGDLRLMGDGPMIISFLEAH